MDWPKCLLVESGLDKEEQVTVYYPDKMNIRHTGKKPREKDPTLLFLSQNI